MGHEFTVRLHAPMRGVVLVDADAPLPPLPPKPEPVPPPAPQPAAPSIVVSEQTRYLREDREVITRTLHNLEKTLQSLETRRQQDLAEWRRAAVELGMIVTSRLVRERVVAGEFAVEAVVREAVGRLEPRKPVVVFLHPDDLALLEKRLDGQPLFRPDADVRVEADAALGRGDCRAEAGDTSVVGRLADQLSELREELLRGLGHAQPGP